MRDYVLEIISQALLRIGDGPIDNLDIERGEVRSAKSVFPAVVDEATASWEWTFARERAELEKAQHTPEHGNYFDLPEDFIQLIEASANEYTIEGNYLWANDDEVSVTYIRSIVELDENGTPVFRDVTPPPAFRTAIECRLASKLSGKYAGNMQLTVSLQQEFDVLLRRAIAQDAMRLPQDAGEPQDWTEIV